MGVEERWASNLDNRGQSTTSHQNQLRLFFFFFQSDSTKHFGVILFLLPFFSWLIAARHPSTPLFFCRQLAWQPRVTSSAKMVAPARCLSIYVRNWNKGEKNDNDNKQAAQLSSRAVTKRLGLWTMNGWYEQRCISMFFLFICLLISSQTAVERPRRPVIIWNLYRATAHLALCLQPRVKILVFASGWNSLLDLLHVRMGWKQGGLGGGRTNTRL